MKLRRRGHLRLPNATQNRNGGRGRPPGLVRLRPGTAAAAVKVREPVFHGQLTHGQPTTRLAHNVGVAPVSGVLSVKPSNLTAISVVILLFVSAGPAEAQAQLRWKFKAGDKVAYTTESKSSIKSLGQELEMQMTVDWTLHVVCVGADSKAALVCKLDRFRMTDADGKLIDSADDKTITREDDKVSTKAMMNKGISLTMDALGQLENVQLPAELVEQNKKTMYPPTPEQLLLQLFMPVRLVLPNEAVAKAKEWKSSPFDASLGATKAKMELAFTSQGTVKRDGKSLEKIGIKAAVTTDKTDDKGKTEGEGEGTVLFDAAAGRVVEQTLQAITKSSFDSGNGVTLTMTLRETKTLKLREAK
jgi:hypothetical protein